jgi:hypothetical protein
VLGLCLLAGNAASLATPTLVFAICFSLSLLTTGIHLTRR